MTLHTRGHRTSNIRVRMFDNVRYVLNIEMFDVRMFTNIQMFESSNVRMFANIRMFACSMFECSLIFFLNPCSRVRMFAEHERTFEHWTQMFIVRWPLSWTVADSISELLPVASLGADPLGAVDFDIFRFFGRLPGAEFGIFGMAMVSEFSTSCFIDNSVSGVEWVCEDISRVAIGGRSWFDDCKLLEQLSV